MHVCVCVHVCAHIYVYLGYSCIFEGAYFKIIAMCVSCSESVYYHNQYRVVNPQDLSYVLGSVTYVSNNYIVASFVYVHVVLTTEVNHLANDP